MNAQITGDYTYRITGHRGTIHYLGFFTQNGNYGTTGGLAPCGALEASELRLEPDGSFEIFLTRERQGENWLKIEEETSLLIVRQTYLDRDSERLATMQIETIGGPATPPPVTARPNRRGSEYRGPVRGRRVDDLLPLGERVPAACQPAPRSSTRRSRMPRAARPASPTTTATGNWRKTRPS